MVVCTDTGWLPQQALIMNLGNNYVSAWAKVLQHRLGLAQVLMASAWGRNFSLKCLASFGTSGVPDHPYLTEFHRKAVAMAPPSVPGARSPSDDIPARWHSCAWNQMSPLPAFPEWPVPPYSELSPPNMLTSVGHQVTQKWHFLYPQLWLPRSLLLGGKRS